MLVVGADTIAASFDIETLLTEDFDEDFPSFDRGSGLAADFLARVEWPTSGFALEAMLANVGKVTIKNVVRRRGTLDVATTNLIEFSDSLDALEFDSTLVDVEVNLPRLVRFSASGWANRILQLDVSTSFGMNTGEYDLPLAIDLGTTWRYVAFCSVSSTAGRRCDRRAPGVWLHRWGGNRGREHVAPVRRRFVGWNDGQRHWVCWPV
jgi:hypothetical protein